MRNGYDAGWWQNRGEPGSYRAGRGGYDRGFDRGGYQQSGYDRGFNRSANQGGYDRGFRAGGSRPPSRYDEPQRGGPGYRGNQQGYGGDYWWLGEREMPRGGRGHTGYDEGYREFSERNRPRFSPVGGMQNGLGGNYASGRPPRPLRENTWFSDWTRWF